MIWQEKVTQIVMLTNLKEGVKVRKRIINKERKLGLIEAFY